ncbi:hypothetical protein E3P84_02039 [Wallemia ichthyophaga]|nr:hypothetical protein E3P84_02039 [Wallemia ichthyophaga]TIB41369.1 hypothetical protein E3P83_02064 [Wallemia ichthyophaga]
MLKIKNPTATPVAFKVKTTAPRSYCVRPNAGRIEPGQTIDIQVLVQAVKEAPPPGTKCKDKFLVQSVHINESRQSLSVADFWSQIEREDKTAVIEQKIRCNWKSTQFETVGEEEPPSDSNARSSASELPQESTPSSHLPPVPETDIKRGLGLDNSETLAGAKKRIEALEYELTQAKKSSSGYSTATATKEVHDGISMPMVAGIAISVFIITYLFL